MRAMVLRLCVGCMNIHYFQHLQVLNGESQELKGTIMENDERPKTISVPEAGRRYFNLARNAAYQAARRGDLPVIRIGGKLRVPIIALERMLAEAGTDKAA